MRSEVDVTQASPPEFAGLAGGWPTTGNSTQNSTRMRTGPTGPVRVRVQHSFKSMGSKALELAPTEYQIAALESVALTSQELAEALRL